MTKCTEALTTKQIEERRQELKAFREELGMGSDTSFRTTLLIQERLLATIDGCDAEKAVLVEALRAARCFFGPIECKDIYPEVLGRWCKRCVALADTSPALLAQGKETAGIETLREMVHAFYEGGRPITKEQLDAFCAVGGEEKE